MNTNDHINLPKQFLLADTESGLKIVAANPRNFYNSNYAIQMCGSKEECQKEMKRLKEQEKFFNEQNRSAAA